MSFICLLFIMPLLFKFKKKFEENCIINILRIVDRNKLRRFSPINAVNTSVKRKNWSSVFVIPATLTSAWHIAILTITAVKENPLEHDGQQLQLRTELPLQLIKELAHSRHSHGLQTFLPDLSVQNKELKMVDLVFQIDRQVAGKLLAEAVKLLLLCRMGCQKMKH